MTLTLNAAELRALAWIGEQHQNEGCAYHIEHYVDTAMVGWVSVTVRFVGRDRRMRPDRCYVMSSTGRVWASALRWSDDEQPARGEMLRDADYDTAGL